jgi:hypothetical protein
LSYVSVKISTTTTYVAEVYKFVSFRSNGLFLLSPMALSAAVSVCLTTPTL